MVDPHPVPEDSEKRLVQRSGEHAGKRRVRCGFAYPTAEKIGCDRMTVDGEEGRKRDLIVFQRRELEGHGEPARLKETCQGGQQRCAGKGAGQTDGGLVRGLWHWHCWY